MVLISLQKFLSKLSSDVFIPCTNRATFFTRKNEMALQLPHVGFFDWTLGIDMSQSQGNGITSAEGWKQWVLLQTKKRLYTCHRLYDTYSQHSLQTLRCPQHPCLSPTLDHNLVPNDQFITLMYHAQVHQRLLQHQGETDNRKNEN